MGGNNVKTRLSKYLAPRVRLAVNKSGNWHLNGIPPPQKSNKNIPGLNSFPVLPGKVIIKAVVFCDGMGTVEQACQYVDGVQVVGVVEIDKTANSVREKCTGDGVPLTKDIAYFTKHVYDFKSVDAKALLISAPCVDYSTRNSNRQLNEGKNGGCVMQACLTALRLSIEANVGPEIVLIENVPGISMKSATSNKPPAVNHVLDELQSMGFSVVSSRSLDAIFTGVAMHREREFMVATKDLKALEILFGKTVIKECDGDCWIGGHGCAQHSLESLASQMSHAASPYIWQMHCAQGNMGKNILSHLTASSGKIAMLGQSGRYLGTFTDEHLCLFMGVQPDLLQDVKSISARMRLLGNAISVRVLVWLLNRVVEVYNAEEATAGSNASTISSSNDHYTYENIDQFIEDHGEHIDDVIARFNGKSWVTGSKPKQAQQFRKTDTMPMNSLHIFGKGSFKVVNVSKYPPGERLIPIEEFISIDELEPVSEDEMYAYCCRCSRNGVVLDADAWSRILLWAGKDAHLVLPEISQRYLADNTILPYETGVVYIKSLDLWVCAELHKVADRPGRGVPQGPNLPLNQYWAMPHPLNKTGTSKLAQLLNLPNEYKGWFIATEGKDLHLSGTPEAVRVCSQSRITAMEATARREKDASILLSLIDDGIASINDIENARQGVPNASSTEIMRRLRSMAAIDILNTKQGRSADRKMLAAACVGHNGATLTQQGIGAINIRISFLWKRTRYNGKIVGYRNSSLETKVRLDGHGKVRYFNLSSHLCLVDMIDEGKKRAKTHFSTKSGSKKKVKITKNVPPMITGNARRTKNDDNNTTDPSSGLSFLKTSHSSRVRHEFTEEDVVTGSELVSTKQVETLQRICLQDYFEYGTVTKDEFDGILVNWESLGVTSGPTSLYRCVGLFKSPTNRGKGTVIDIYFDELYKCARSLFKHLAQRNKPGNVLKLSLSFVAPEGCSDAVKAIMPVILCGAKGRLLPQYADITVFDGLSDEEKKRARLELLIAIYRVKGMLPAAAYGGSNASVSFWSNGDHLVQEMEIPQFKSRFVVD